MVRWTVDQLRERFLEFFEGKGHKRLPSASLVPHGDPTLLLTGAGMVPFKPYFLGRETPQHRRVTTCQRCLRTPDIDNVGKTDRHGTFFEMMGNFSFGDYFKRDAIGWAWEFVTEQLDIDKQDLWITIYLDDDEAFHTWNQEIGVPADRIVRLGRADNFWEIGVGPCGPCSEIHLDRGPEIGCGRPDCSPGCECDRFLEFWNLVFIQFYQDEAGNLTPLEHKGIDTGMGLDRTAAVLQKAKSIFETDLVRPIVAAVAKRAGVEYGSSAKADVSLRVITDHMRGVTFMIHDGILPGNEGRGYVLRRLLRRSVRHARLLGIEDRFLSDMVEVVAGQMETGYPEIRQRLDYVKHVVDLEEQRFHETLDQGMEILEKLMDRIEKEGQIDIAGQEAFRLYDTYGFPLELTREITEDRGFHVSEEEFDVAMQAQRDRARAARVSLGYMGDDKPVYSQMIGEHKTRFVGYDQLETEAAVLAMVQDGEAVSVVERGQDIEVVLEETPFYPEGGGQVADTGTLTGRDGQIVIESVKRVAEGLIVHRGTVTSGTFAVGDRVLATVDRKLRWDTARNHTATHLMHKALHEILGEHAKQAGSLVAPDRLRFDFTHFEPVSPEELFEIERRVNQRILDNLPVDAQVMNFDQAQKQGAMALFGEKYGDEVRVIRVGDYSMELCGGTHVRASGDLGLFKIVAENGVAAGVRRVEAVTGKGALRLVDDEEKALRSVANRLQVPAVEVPQQVDKVLVQLRNMEKEVESLKNKLAHSQLNDLVDQAERIDGSRILVTRVRDVDMNGLRSMGDLLRDKLGSAAVLLGAESGGKALFLAMATKDLVQKGVKAGDIVREAAEVTGGGGGGRPDMAQAGGKDPSKLDSALQRAGELLRRQLTHQ